MAEPSSPPAEGASAKARLWSACLPAMVLPVLMALGYFVWLEGRPAARVLYLAAKLFLLAWPLLASLFLLSKRPGPPFRNTRRHLAALPLGLASGITILALGALVLLTPLGDLAAAAAPGMRAKAVEFGVFTHFTLFAAGFSLFNATAEEYYWRWFVFGGLRRLLPRPAAHLAAALAFSAHHVVVMAVIFPRPWGAILGLATALGGLCWSWLFERQESLAGAWVSHLVVDLGLLAIGARLMGI